MILGSLVPFTKNQLEQIHGEVIELLKTVGVKVVNDKLRRELQRKGLEVDNSSKRVKFSLDQIEETIRLIRDDGYLPENGQITSGGERFTSVGEKLGFPYGISGTPFLYDWSMRKVVKPTREHLVEIIKVGEAVKEAGVIGAPVLMSEVDPRIERVVALSLLIENTSKPVSIDYYYASQLKYVLELLDLVGQRLILGGGFMISPLTLGERTAECLLEELKYGVPAINIGSEPIAGASAPVTTVGTVVLGVAELLGGWIIVKALNQRVKVGGNVVSGVMDMTTSKVCFSTPQAVVQDAGISQLCEEIYNVRNIIIASPAWVDAKTPGIQAVWEKCYKQLALGCPSYNSFHYGLLDGGRLFCPTQMIIDYEMNNMLQATFRGFQIDEELMAIADMQRIIETSGNFLECEHTLRHFRNSMWTPRVMDTTMWRGDSLEKGADKTLLRKAEKAWRDSLRKYRPVHRSSEIMRQARDIIRRAKEELL